MIAKMALVITSMKQILKKEIENLHAIIRSNIKKVRTQKKETQLNIGLAIGHASASFYAKAETGFKNKKFSLDHLYKIAKVLDVDICEFFQGIDTKSSEKIAKCNLKINGIEVIPWNNDFNLGIPEIDQQHYKLVEIINQLAMNFICNKNIDLLTIFDELIAYTQYHFYAEEKIWNQYFSNDMNDRAHKDEHKAFIHTLKSLIKNQEGKNIEHVAENTLDFLIPWLLEHTLEADRYMAYMVFAIQEGKNSVEAQEIAQKKIHTMTKVIKRIYKILSKNSLQLMHQVTLQHKTEQKIHIQEKFLKTLIRTIPDPIWVKDPNGVYITCNPRFEQLYGETEENIIGKNDYDFVQKNVADLFREQDKKAAITLSSLTLKEWNTFADGHKEFLEITKAPLLDDQNNIIGVLGVARNITHYKLAEQKLQKAAYYDQLTNLPNRLFLYEKLEQIVIQTKQQKTYIAIIYIDLDGFKEINDTHGHGTGDQLLIAFSKRLKKLLKQEDIFARLGGDEFIIILEHICDLSHIESILDRFLLTTESPFLINELYLTITASWGVTFYPQKEEILSYEQLLRQSDQAMYHAKQLGKNCYKIFTHEITE